MVRVVFRIVLVFAVLRAVGAIVSRRLDSGTDADANEFSIATVFGGVDRESRATALLSGEVFAVCGGVQLDLREAILDPAGADIRVSACLGGIQVVVPDTWRVTVEPTVVGGGIDVSVASEDELASDAPSLRVEATAVLGGVQVTTAADDDEADDADGADGTSDG